MASPASTVGRFFLFVGISSLLFVSWRRLTRDTDQERTDYRKVSARKGMSDASDKWRFADLYQMEVPSEVVTRAKGVQVKTEQMSIMGVNMHYLEAPGDATHVAILLLHGAAFSSKTWLDLGTIQIMSAAGHRTIAVDLPGYGKTRDQFRGDKTKFMSELVSTLGLCTSGYVLVSPSMSGGYSVPFVTSNPDCAPKGYIPVAPVGTDGLGAKLKDVHTPTLIVYGSRDKGLGHRSRDNLSKLPNSKVVELEDAGHPAYLDQADRWHRLIYNFVGLIA